MISRKDLRALARERLKDADVLLVSNRFDGAVYLGGYVVELALKARICRTLGWVDFPQTRSEFQNFSSFKTHDLDVLLTLSGVEKKVKAQYFAEWSAVANWNPEARYGPAGTATESSAKTLIAAARILLRIL